ncbi:MAG: GntR family transcriptional regulator [bacterium]
MFQIDYKSHKSIYEQVVDEIKGLIVKDVLKENSKLPSVRELSKELMVNPNTVAKAFKELDRQGYIYTVAGRGTFVSPRSDLLKDPIKQKKLLDEIKEAYLQLLYMGYSADELKEMLEQAFNDIHEERRNR